MSSENNCFPECGELALCLEQLPSDQVVDATFGSFAKLPEWFYDFRRLNSIGKTLEAGKFVELLRKFRDEEL